MPIGRATVVSGRSGEETRRPTVRPSVKAAGDLGRRQATESTPELKNASTETKTEESADEKVGNRQRGRAGYNWQNHNLQQNNAEEDESKNLSPFADGYDARDLFTSWMELNSRLTMSDWSCYIRTGRRKKDRTQIDDLVSKVCCEVLGMRELARYSTNNGQNCLLWLNNSLSRKYIHHMRKGAHIIGRVFCDTILKDKQSMCNLFANHMFKEWLEYPKHVCSNTDSPGKRSLQRVCRHQYLKHCMSKCIDTEDGKCPNHTYNFCECFRRHFFLPESFSFSHFSMMEDFLKKYETDDRFTNTKWLAKPAYMSGGKGIFMIRNPSEFRFFYLVRSDTCVRREGFVLQRYLDRTCTLYHSKVDCRMYLLIMVLNGRRVCGFFHSGYTRNAANQYTLFEKAKPSIDIPIFEHLTSGDLYTIMKAKEGSDDDDEDNIQCLDFNQACEAMVRNNPRDKNAEKEVIAPFSTEEETGAGGQETQDTSAKFQWRFKYMITTICKKLDPIICDKPGTFQIFGLDILIDSDTKPWLLEINSHVATERIYDANQAKIISNVVTESICLVCEMLQKSLQEEEITMELHQGNCRLSKLSRAQRLLTAMDEQKKLDELAELIKQTDISPKRRPIFLKNFFWWYDTPRYRWLRPWVIKKPKQKREVAWYSRTFASLINRSEALAKKTIKSTAFSRQLDTYDFHTHTFWREKLEKKMNAYEQTLEARDNQARKKADQDRRLPVQETTAKEPQSVGENEAGAGLFELMDDNDDHILE